MEATVRLRAVVLQRLVHTRLLEPPTSRSPSASTKISRSFSDAALEGESEGTRRARNYWKSLENQRAFLVALAPKLGLREGEFEGWYKISNLVMKKHGGGTLLAMHNSSMLTLLREVFPERTWEEAKFRKHSRNFWRAQVNQRRYLEKLGQKLGIGSGDLSGWYKVTNEQVMSNGGAGLLNRGTLATSLRSAFPEHPWDSSKFSKKSGKYWADVGNQRKSLLEIGEKLGIREGDLEKWYKVPTRDFKLNGGISLLTLHDFSLIKILRHVFPDHLWDTKKLSRRPRQYWASNENLRLFVDGVGLKLGISPGESEKWYKISAKEVRKLGGSSMLSAYNSSLPNLLQKAYPEVAWDRSLFKGKKPQKFWASAENQRALLDGIGTSLGIGKNELEKWYKVRSTQLQRTPASSPFLSYHNGSVKSMVMAAYPEHDWEPWKFTRSKKTIAPSDLPLQSET